MVALHEIMTSMQRLVVEQGEDVGKLKCINDVGNNASRLIFI